MVPTEDVGSRGAERRTTFGPMPSAARAPGRRTQEERSAATRKAILEAATERLIAEGLDGVTVAAVAKGAGVSSGALLHHYTSKLELILALTTYLSLQARDEVVLSVDPDASPAERVAVMVDTLMAATHDDRTRAQLELHTAARTDPHLAEEILVLNAESAGTYMTLLGQVFGDAPVPDERKIAAMELAVFAALGHSLLTISGTDPAIDERLADSIRRVVLGEIAAAESAEA